MEDSLPHKRALRVPAMPYGATNAPVVLQMFINNYVITYIDNIHDDRVHHDCTMLTWLLQHQL